MAKSNEPKNFTTVNKLCCCLSLKTGMTIVGWIKFVLSVLAVAVGFAQIIAYLIDESLDYLNINVPDLGIITFSVLIIVFNALNAYVFYIFIQGIKLEIDSKILPYLILNGVYIFFVLFATVAAMNVYMLIGLLIYIYIYICAFNLYSIFSSISTEYNVV
ncbi:hypothetical protein ACKWTF_009379 [Chironomus riparius]